MDIMSFVFFVLFFLFCQTIVEKSRRIKRIIDMKTSKIVIFGVLIIIASILISVPLHLEIIVVPIITILVSSIITTKFRKVFTTLEKGNKV